MKLTKKRIISTLSIFITNHTIFPFVYIIYFSSGCLAIMPGLPEDDPVELFYLTVTTPDIVPTGFN